MTKVHCRQIQRCMDSRGIFALRAMPYQITAGRANSKRQTKKHEKRQLINPQASKQATWVGVELSKGCRCTKLRGVYLRLYWFVKGMG